ncbi:MAG: DUF547 domain-containing protein [Parvibaculum sp.]|nr:DUF547 domain-containing protein [Parvibaculum sp.]
MTGQKMCQNRLPSLFRTIALIATMALVTLPAKAETPNAIWGSLLKTYVSTPPDEINRFDYAHISDTDRERLVSYLDQMQKLDPSKMPDDEQRAYWINLYNALTVKVVLDHYPVKSIRDIRSGFFSIGPWNDELARVSGKDLSLNNIEHDILRKRWKDNRIHYALNCASLGCPNLQPEPFTAQRLNEQLDHAARAYVNHPRGASIRNGRLTVSSIYKWYAEDFGNSDKSVIAHIASFATADRAAELNKISDISAHQYDWKLNAPDTAE